MSAITRDAILAHLAICPYCAGRLADVLAPTEHDGCHSRAAWEGAREEAEKILRDLEQEGMVMGSAARAYSWDDEGGEGREYRLMREVRP